MQDVFHEQYQYGKPIDERHQCQTAWPHGIICRKISDLKLIDAEVAWWSLEMGVFMGGIGKSLCVFLFQKTWVNMYVTNYLWMILALHSMRKYIYIYIDSDAFQVEVILEGRYCVDLSLVASTQCGSRERFRTRKKYCISNYIECILYMFVHNLMYLYIIYMYIYTYLITYVYFGKQSIQILAISLHIFIYIYLYMF